MPYALDLSEDAHNLLCQLSAGTIDATSGVISGCTVAKANVEAKGKVLLLDSKGKPTRDRKLAVKELPIFTDPKFLATLMAAVQDAGGRLKVREDHDDSIGARAGSASAFKLEGDRVTADLKLLDSYRNRGVVLEVAAKTPDAIGLSIDFFPEFEIIGEKAYMRVVEISAVDIVDEGAVTPDGLLLSARVDTAGKDTPPLKLKTDPTMPTPTPEEIMTALSALSTKVEQCMAALAAAKPAGSDAMAAILNSNQQLTASVGELKTNLEAVKAEQVRLKKERLILGLSAMGGDRGVLGSKTADELETLAAGQKTYTQLRADAQGTLKLSGSAIHAHIVSTPAGRAAYEAHMVSKGIVKAAA